ncbi:MAG: S8 family serine peptidase [Bacteroidetes bacterium]|nr:S8 family serine peptidase [Bacteroidota bacterium]
MIYRVSIWAGRLMGCIWFLAGAHAQAQHADVLHGRLVVKIKPAYRAVCSPAAVAVTDLEQVLTRYNGRLEKKFPREEAPDLRAVKGSPQWVDLSLVYTVWIPAQTDPREVARGLNHLSCVAYAEPEYIAYPLSFTPNDGNYPGWISHLHMEGGWALTNGDTNVVIGIIDSGTKWDHPDLQPNLKVNYADPVNGVDDDGDGYIDNYAGWDFVGSDGRVVDGLVSFVPDNDTRPRLSDVPVGSSVTTTLGHGTWVAGCAAAATNNGFGVPGTGFNCKFLPIKLMHDWNGGGLYFTTDAIYYAATHGVRVINLSLGSNNYSQLQQEVVNFATFNRNVSVVAAAGNGISEQYVYPASYDNVLSVTTFGTTDELQNAYGKRVDVGATGSGLTTDMQFDYRIPPGGNYTSISSPLAAGIVALIRSYFPSLTAVQAMERARVTCDNVYGVNTNPLYAYKLGKGRLNLERALTVASPSIRNLNWQVVDDADNVPDPGNVVWLNGQFINYLNNTSNLKISIQTSDPYITLQSSSHTVGTLNTLQTFTLTSNSLRMLISASTPSNHTAELLFIYQDGAYTDFEHFSIVLNPSFQHISSANVATSVGMDGKWGQNSYTPNSWQGQRFRLGEYSDYLWEGSFLLGSNANTCANNLRTGGGSRSDHFTSLQKPTRILNPQYSDEEVVVRFSDAGLGAHSQGLQVRQHAYGFMNGDFQNMIIFRYLVENTKPFSIQNVYAALAADWDFETNVLRDTARYDATRQMLYGFGLENAANRDGCRAYTGIVLLNSEYAPNAYTINVAGFNFSSQAEKFTAISSGTASAETQGVDILQVMGAGPFDILPLGTREIAFALVGGCSLTELQQAADAAHNKYVCMFKETALTIHLGPDTIACDSYTLDGTVPGASSYQWEPASLGTGPVVEFTQSGIYRLTAFDAGGCPYEDQFTLTLVSKPQPHVELNGTTFNLALDEQMSFTETAQGISGWQWNFGDGYGFQGKTGTHQYLTSGEYEIRLVTSNGVCTDTAYRTVTVIHQPANRAGSQTSAHLAVYPNPVAAGSTIHLSHTALGGQTLDLAFYNTTGQCVWVANRVACSPEGHATVLLPDLPKGIYMAQAKHNGHAFTARILIR